jgi:hypothetical protein
MPFLICTCKFEFPLNPILFLTDFLNELNHPFIIQEKLTLLNKFFFLALHIRRRQSNSVGPQDVHRRKREGIDRKRPLQKLPSTHF